MNITTEILIDEATRIMRDSLVSPEAIAQLKYNHNAMVSGVSGLYKPDTIMQGVIRNFENEYHVLVYMILKTPAQFAFLYVDGNTSVRDEGNTVTLPACVFDKNDISDKRFADVVVAKRAGGLLRLY